MFANDSSASILLLGTSLRHWYGLSPFRRHCVGQALLIGIELGGGCAVSTAAAV